MIDERSVVIVREGSFMIGREGNVAYTRRQTVSGSIYGIRYGIHLIALISCLSLGEIVIEWLFVFG